MSTGGRARRSFETIGAVRASIRWTVAPADGSGLRRLTHTGAGQPAPCAGGAILFVRCHNLLVLSRDGRHVRRLTRGGGEQPSCAPDDRVVVFVRRGGLYTRTMFSPDGRRIAHLTLIKEPSATCDATCVQRMVKARSAPQERRLARARRARDRGECARLAAEPDVVKCAQPPASRPKLFVTPSSAEGLVRWVVVVPDTPDSRRGPGNGASRSLREDCPPRRPRVAPTSGRPRRRSPLR